MRSRNRLDSSSERPMRRERELPADKTQPIIPKRSLSHPMASDTPITKTMFTGPQLRGQRGGEYLHVSDLIYKCVRKKALSLRGNLPIAAEKMWDTQGITFSIGHMIGDYVVARVLASDGRLFGRWKCRCGQVTEDNTMREDALHKPPCRSCNGQFDIYDELHLVCEDLMLQGHCDLALLWGVKYYLTEVKSVGNNGWNAIESSPDMDHIIQLLFYYYMAKAMHLPVHEFGSIFYVRKEFKIGSPYREHKINLENELHRLEPYIEEAQEYARFMDNGILPPRKMCSDMGEKKALGCQFCMDCFADET